MLGEQLGEETGQTTGRRILPGTDGLHPQVEASFESTGTVLGTAYQNVGTYTATPRFDGTFAGVGQGVVMTADGAVVMWSGTGVGRFTETGAQVWRGGLVYETTSEKYARLNTVIGMFEYEVSPEGKTVGSFTEWK